MTTKASVKHQIQVGDIVEQLSVDRLVPAADNPRTSVGDVGELAASIRALGVLEPLVAQPSREGFEGFYDLVFGHRRLAAAKLAGLATVPVLVRQFTEAERLEAMLTENLQRQDLTPLEEARAFKRLVDLHDSQRQVAKRIGCSQAHVSRRVGLLELPTVARDALMAGAITVKDAEQLGKLVALPDRLQRALLRATGQLDWDDEVLVASGSTTVGEAVRAELDDQGRLDRIEQLRQDLDAASVRVIHWPSPGDPRPKERPLLEAGGWPGRPLPIEPAEHAGQPCHAAAIEPEHGAVVYLCTDPTRHAQALGVETPASARRSRGATGEAARVQREATRARREFITRALGGKLPPGATELALRRYLEGTRAGVARVACALLGLRPDVEGRPHGADFRAALERRAADRGGLAVVAGALALAQGEVQARSGQAPALESHLEFLRSLGYEPTEWEQEEGEQP